MSGQVLMSTDLATHKEWGVVTVLKCGFCNGFKGVLHSDTDKLFRGKKYVCDKCGSPIIVSQHDINRIKMAIINSEFREDIEKTIDLVKRSKDLK